MEKKFRITTIIIILAVVIFAVRYFNRPIDEYPYTSTVSGVPVKSKIPIDSMQNWGSIALLSSEDLATIACNLQLSAISGGSTPGGYPVDITYGEPYIVINNGGVVISGETKSDLLYVCHAFSCLKSGIACPDDLSEIQRILWDVKHINVVIDENISSGVGRAYAELLGPLSYYQAQRVDTNGDGELSQDEIAANDVFIYPYIQYGDTCVLQPLNNIVQKLKPTNQSRDCDISPAIYFEESNKSELVVNGDKIYFRGNPDSLEIQSIIVGNIVAPEWIIKFRGVI